MLHPYSSAPIFCTRFIQNQMAYEFTEDLQNLKPLFSGINYANFLLTGNDQLRALENFNSTDDRDFIAFSNGNSYSNDQQQPYLPMNFASNIQGLVPVSPTTPAVPGTGLSENIKVRNRYGVSEVLLLICVLISFRVSNN